MDSSQQALQTYEKLFSSFKLVSEILSENLKIYKRMEKREYWSKLNVLRICQWVLTRQALQTNEKLFQISIFFSKFWPNRKIFKTNW